MSQNGDQTLDDRAFERLSAYLDGDVSEVERAAIEVEIAENPSMAQALNEMRSLTAELKAAYPLHVDLPNLATPRGPSRARARQVQWQTWRRGGRSTVVLAAAGAAAAALAVGVGIGSLWPSGLTLDGTIAAGEVAAHSTLSELLETARVGEAASHSDGKMVVLGTFLTSAGAACREFENLSAMDASLTFGVACRSDDEGWRVLFAAMASPEEDADGRITPASGPGLDAMDQLLESLNAGPMLSAEEEESLIENGWR